MKRNCRVYIKQQIRFWSFDTFPEGTRIAYHYKIILNCFRNLLKNSNVRYKEVSYMSRGLNVAHIALKQKNE